jgi:hypothetical protein
MAGRLRKAWIPDPGPLLVALLTPYAELVVP